jgi:hypothetical protein
MIIATRSETDPGNANLRIGERRSREREWGNRDT